MGGDWVWHVGAVVLGAGAVWLFAWAWWGDRSRGRARCGRCWYSMEGLAVEGYGLPVCPECGWKAKKHGRLFATRRRRVWAAAAVFLAAGAAACGVMPKVRQDGPWSVAPTWLMWSVLWTGRVPEGGFAEELSRRVGEYKAMGPAAERVYRWAPSVQLTRAKGVKGVPLRAWNNSGFGRNYLRGGLQFNIDGWIPNDADVDSVQSHENWWTPGVYVPRPSPGWGKSGWGGSEYVTRLACASTVGPPFERFSSFELHIPLADSIDEVMGPVSIGRERLIDALKPSVFVLPTTRCLALSVSDAAESNLGGPVALGMKMEIVRRGEVVGRGRWFQGAESKSVAGRPVLVRFGPYDPVKSVNGPMTCELEELIADGCVARFSTDEEMALAALGYDKYWRGSFEVPLKELVGK